MKELFFPTRSERWVKNTFSSGAYGRVVRDAGGWLVSESAVGAYQDRHAVGEAVRTYNSGNLVQFQKSSRV